MMRPSVMRGVVEVVDPTVVVDGIVVEVVARTVLVDEEVAFGVVVVAAAVVVVGVVIGMQTTVSMPVDPEHAVPGWIICPAGQVLQKAQQVQYIPFPQGYE